ncbi:MAG TPA: DNA mismatch repair protein MutS, partial [Geminicoccaceae bacterium]
MSAGGQTTPMIAQFQAIKAEHADCLLFFRMGDFYELFFEDAQAAAPALDIALTRRGRHDGDDIPMCGVPVHSAEVYLERLIRKGFKVAICEQMEDPKEARRRGAKAVVARDVVRVVTPGTLTEDTLLDARANNYLAALAGTRQEIALAWLDVSTGEVRAMPVEPAALAAALARIDPGELLVPERMAGPGCGLGPWRDRLTPLPDPDFDSLAGERRLRAVYRVGELGGFGPLGRAEIGALGALLGYVERTQRGRLPHLGPPRRVIPGSHLAIDPATRQNLELIRSLGGERRGSLLDAVDRTVTGAGARLLSGRIAAPLADPAPIRQRLEAVSALVEDPGLRDEVRDRLKGAPDLERALSRLSLGRAGPRDLAAIRSGLERARELRVRLDDGPPALGGYAAGLAELEELIGTLGDALVESPPLLAQAGGFVRTGHAPELDRQQQLRDHGRKLIVALERRLQQTAGIPSLKVRHNNLLGYYIEVTQTHRAKVPDDFIQRQSMANATRYSTVELQDLERQIGEAGERALAIELGIFERLVARVLEEAAAIARTAGAHARLDVAAGLAALAVERRYARPEIDDGDGFEIEGGRHPVVEQALARDGKPFIPNDADLSPARRLWLMTGPNMAGKSTFLRQNAL